MSEIKQLDVRKGNLNLIQTAARFLSRYSHINWALADQTMVSGINFLTGILLARFLGNRGVWTIYPGMDGRIVCQQHPSCHDQ